jgi:hypothetical protein
MKKGPNMTSDIDPIDVSPLRAAQLLEAVKMLCGCIDGTGDLLEDAGVKACYNDAKRLWQEVDREANPELQIEIVTLSDCASPTQPWFVAAEMSYRRGYNQGYFQASEDERRFSSSEVDDHFNNALTNWRYREPTDRPVFPPELNRRPKKTGGVD